jgi:CheY-like chemotaxis protein
MDQFLKMPMEPKRILVVDNNPLVCDAMKLMLESEQHLVMTASCGMEALAKAELKHFDLIVVDYCMPGMRGDELAAELKTQNSSTRIIMLTASPPWDRVPNVEQVLKKPCSLERMRGALEQVWANGIFR